MTAVVGLALTSCSQEELSAPVAENNEITFAAPLVVRDPRAGSPQPACRRQMELFSSSEMSSGVVCRNPVCVPSDRQLLPLGTDRRVGFGPGDRASCVCVCVCVRARARASAQSLSRVRLFVTPWTVVSQAPLSMRFSKPEYWSELPCPYPGDLPDLGTKPRSPALQVDS